MNNIDQLIAELQRIKSQYPNQTCRLYVKKNLQRHDIEDIEVFSSNKTGVMVYLIVDKELNHAK